MFYYFLLYFVGVAATAEAPIKQDVFKEDPVQQNTFTVEQISQLRAQVCSSGLINIVSKDGKQFVDNF